MPNVFWQPIVSRTDGKEVGIELLVGYPNKKLYRTLATVYAETKQEGVRYSWYTFDADGVAGISGVADFLLDAKKEAAHAVITQGFIDLGRINGK